MVRGESEGGPGDKGKNKVEKGGKQKLEGSEILSDKTSKAVKDVEPKDGKGKRAAHTKVIP